MTKPMNEQVTETMTKLMAKPVTKPATKSEICGFGIGRNCRPIKVSVSVSDRNQNCGFGRSLLQAYQGFIHYLILPKICLGRRPSAYPCG
jgi:hypothetical protein